jgi:uncharacterized Zn finger protein (UPF0148 family)
MFCPQCGAPNEDDAVFCGNCGAVLDPEQVAEVESSDTAEDSEEVTGEAPSEEEVIEETAVEEAEAEVPLDAEPVEEAIEESLDEPASFLVEAPPPASPPTRSATATSTVETSGMAIASLVLGIAGWTLLPVIGSILAIILGYMARNEIRQRPDELGGEGLALAGIVLGWLMIGAAVLMACLGGLGICFFFGLVGASGSGY